MMRPSRSGSRTRQDLISKFQSPTRRRVTRSQSRNVDETQPNGVGSKNDSRNNAQEQSKALSSVVEESPFRTPQKPSARYGSSAVVPESPDDAANISGTTLLQSEPESELDPELMLEALPDLQRTGKSVLDFLAPTTASPVQIVNKAKLLSDPRNTQSKRLRRLIGNLDRDTGYFGSETYIDAVSLGRKFTSVIASKREEFNDWSPEPIIQSANCARFALEVLLAGNSLNSQRQAIRSVEKLFPLPFLTGLVGTERERGPGESALEKETFDLALEIRKQSLIMLLDDKQSDPDFNAKNAVKLCFFTGLSRKAPPRGFNLPSLGGLDSPLPPRYRDTIQHVYDDILLSEEDGGFDVDELRSSYLWKRFVLQAAQWLRKRTEEIHAELEMRMSAQDVHDAYFTSKHPSFASTLGGSASEPPNVQEVEPETTQQSEQQQPEPTISRRNRERRRSSKHSYLNVSSIQRIAQRQERLRSGPETSDNRRQSDIGPVSQTSRQLEANRRETISALPSSRPDQQAAARENPSSFEGASLTLVADEPAFSLHEDSQLAMGDESTQIERSHSPPTIPRNIAPWRRDTISAEQRANRETPSQRGRATDQLPSIQELWAMTQDSVPEQSIAGPSRSTTARFIDRQQHAERISPIRDSNSPSAVGRVEERVSRKRTRPSSDSDSESGSDIYDYDSRPVDLDRRRAEKPAQSQSRSKRQRVEAPEADADAHEVDDSNEPASEVEPPHPVPRRRQPAAIDSAPSTPSKYKSTAKRAWSEGEDNRLKRLMSEHGPSWATLVRQNTTQPEQEGEVRIEGRDQVAFKDRARNMKIACYRYDLCTLGRYL
ncbi:hypothetical protein BDV06DRAFT_206379 [Aspergillus oleicola]